MVETGLWCDFVVLENVNSRAWACWSELINDLVFIQICFSSLSLIHKLSDEKEHIYEAVW